MPRGKRFFTNNKKQHKHRPRNTIDDSTYSNTVNVDVPKLLKRVNDLEQHLKKLQSNPILNHTVSNSNNSNSIAKSSDEQNNLNNTNVQNVHSMQQLTDHITTINLEFKLWFNGAIHELLPFVTEAKQFLNTNHIYDDSVAFRKIFAKLSCI